MKKVIQIELSDDELASIEYLIRDWNAVIDEQGIDVGNTHGKLTLARLAQMLLEDVAMTNMRPGSWEGSNMQQVLTSHGYN